MVRSQENGVDFGVQYFGFKVVFNSESKFISIMELLEEGPGREMFWFLLMMEEVVKNNDSNVDLVVESDINNDWMPV